MLLNTSIRVPGKQDKIPRVWIPHGYAVDSIVCSSMELTNDRICTVPVLANVSVSEYCTKQWSKICHKHKHVVDGCSPTVAELQLPSQVNNKNGYNMTQNIETTHFTVTAETNV